MPESSDEDDFFSNLSKNKEKRKPSFLSSTRGEFCSRKTARSGALPSSLHHHGRSSMKRHHGATSIQQQSKMDALLQELEQEKIHLEQQTNICVGNLKHSVSQHQLVEYFRQFGDLYSVKLSRPRSPGEPLKAYVCFMNRQDAQAAIDAANNTDPFRMGCLVSVDWDKLLVKKNPSASHLPIKKIPFSASRMLRKSPDSSAGSPHQRRAGSYDSPSYGAVKGTARDDEYNLTIDNPKGDCTGKPARGEAALTDDERRLFQDLFVNELCGSRDAVCRAMAFAFEKSGSASQIVAMLFDMLCHPKNGVSVDTLVARLYVLSDILYNSQQPGIRNAFLYRDAIEKIAPDLFFGLGVYAREQTGRLRRERLTTTLSSIFAAWTNWGVYDPVFIDGLQDRFEGREMKPIEPQPEEHEPVVESKPKPVEEKEVVTLLPRGDWVTMGSDETENFETEESNIKVAGDPSIEKTPATDGLQPMDNVGGASPDDIDGEPLEEDDIDGLPLGDDDGDSDVDGEILNENEVDGAPHEDPDNELLEEDVDGDVLEDDEVDGASLEEDPDEDD